MDGSRTQNGLIAAQVTGPGRIEMVSSDLPQPAPGKVRVAIEGCGVCASNLGPWAGPDWMSFPLAPGELGHEAWGRIDALGEGVDPRRHGERVAILGTCGFASHDIVPESLALPVPPALDGRAVPAEPLGCALAVFRMSSVRRGETIAIIGIGFMGALLVRLAADAGARVIALSRNSDNLRRARNLGAAETVALHDHEAVKATLADLTGGRGCDTVIECTGHQWPLDLAAEIARESGRLVIAGYHQDGPRQVNMQLWNWRALEIVNAHVRDMDAVARTTRDAIALVAEGRIDPDPLYTHSYPLDRLDVALDATRDKPEGFVKALVTMP